MEDIIKLLLEGKKVYLGDESMNAFIDGKAMIFENDEEAIAFYADYEAIAYAFYLEDDELKTRVIYDPCDFF